MKIKRDEEIKKQLEAQLAKKQERFAELKGKCSDPEHACPEYAIDTLGEIACLQLELGMDHLPALQEALGLARSIEHENCYGKSSQLCKVASYFCHFGHLGTAGEIIGEIKKPYYKAHALIALSEWQKGADLIATLEKAFDLVPSMDGSRTEIVGIIARRFLGHVGFERALEAIKKLSSPRERLEASMWRGRFGSLPYGESLIMRLDFDQQLELLLAIAHCETSRWDQIESLVGACDSSFGYDRQKDFIKISALGKLALQTLEAGGDPRLELSKIREIRKHWAYQDSTSCDRRLLRQMLFMRLAIKLAESSQLSWAREIQSQEHLTAHEFEAQTDFIARWGYTPRGAEEFTALYTQLLERIEACSSFWARSDKECDSVRQKAEERRERHSELIRKKARADCAAIQEKAALDCRSLPSIKSGDFQKPDFTKKPAPQPAEAKAKQGDKV